MILQGRVQVEFGKETLVFEGGPFVYFGAQALGMIAVLWSMNVCYFIYLFIYFVSAHGTQFPRAEKLRK